MPVAHEGLSYLSDKLLAPDHPTLWYDHLLRPEEVSNLVERVAKQIVGYQVAGLVYFTKPLAKEQAVIPYHNTIVAACSEVKRPFIVVELDDERLGD